MRQRAPTDPRECAVGLLARREHSAAELAAKLAARGTDREQAQEIVASLAAKGLQSDRRYAETFARSRAASWGRPRILRELAAKRVDAAVAAEATDAALGAHAAEGDGDGSEAQRALAALRKRFREPAADARERARHWRFLQSRGFDAGAAKHALRAHAQPEEDC